MPPVTVMPPVIVLAAESVATPPLTFRPPAETVTPVVELNVPPLTLSPPDVIASVPEFASDPPLTLTPWAMVALVAMVAAPAADLVSELAASRPPVRLTLPEGLVKATVPAVMPPASSVIADAVPSVALSLTTKGILEPVPSCCQLAVV